MVYSYRDRSDQSFSGSLPAILSYSEKFKRIDPSIEFAMGMKIIYGSQNTQYLWLLAAGCSTIYYFSSYRQYFFYTHGKFVQGSIQSILFGMPFPLILEKDKKDRSPDRIRQGYEKQQRWTLGPFWKSINTSRGEYRRQACGCHFDIIFDTGEKTGGGMHVQYQYIQTRSKAKKEEEPSWQRQAPG